MNADWESARSARNALPRPCQQRRAHRFALNRTFAAPIKSGPPPSTRRRERSHSPNKPSSASVRDSCDAMRRTLLGPLRSRCALHVCRVVACVACASHVYVWLLTAHVRMRARSAASRTNALSGLAYADDATILAWELCNEPRAVSEASQQARHRAAYMRWVQQTAARIRSLAPRQLIAVGSEGTTPFGEYINVNWEATHRLSEIDVLTAHVWPQNWGCARDAARAAPPRTRGHARSSRSGRCVQ
jgi:hypothetical protein